MIVDDDALQHQLIEKIFRLDHCKGLHNYCYVIQVLTLYVVYKAKRGFWIIKLVHEFITTVQVFWRSHASSWYVDLYYASRLDLTKASLLLLSSSPTSSHLFRNWGKIRSVVNNEIIHRWCSRVGETAVMIKMKLILRNIMTCKCYCLII